MGYHRGPTEHRRLRNASRGDVDRSDRESAETVLEPDCMETRPELDEGLTHCRLQICGGSHVSDEHWRAAGESRFGWLPRQGKIGLRGVPPNFRTRLEASLRCAEPRQRHLTMSRESFKRNITLAGIDASGYRSLLLAATKRRNAAATLAGPTRACSAATGANNQFGMIGQESQRRHRCLLPLRDRA